MVGYIQPDLYQAIHLLRGIRNAAAHSRVGFRLLDHEGELKKIYSLASGEPHFITKMAGSAGLHFWAHNVIEKIDQFEIDAEGNLPFVNIDEIIEYIKQDKDLFKIHEERLPRFELSIGVAIICGMIIDVREKRLNNSA